MFSMRIKIPDPERSKKKARTHQTPVLHKMQNSDSTQGRVIHMNKFMILFLLTIMFYSYDQGRVYVYEYEPKVIQTCFDSTHCFYEQVPDITTLRIRVMPPL